MVPKYGLLRLEYSFDGATPQKAEAEATIDVHTGAKQTWAGIGAVDSAEIGLARVRCRISIWSRKMEP